MFRLRPDGDLTFLLNNVPSPNGLVMNRDEPALLVVITRAKAVWRVLLRVSSGARQANVLA